MKVQFPYWLLWHCSVLVSFFGRINLGWKDKYLAELNLRTDGSSRFARKKRWGYFPSLSAAWRLDQEAFMEKVY